MRPSPSLPLPLPLPLPPAGRPAGRSCRSARRRRAEREGEGEGDGDMERGRERERERGRGRGRGREGVGVGVGVGEVDVEVEVGGREAAVPKASSCARVPAGGSRCAPRAAAAVAQRTLGSCCLPVGAPTARGSQPTPATARARAVPAGTAPAARARAVPAARPGGPARCRARRRPIDTRRTLVGAGACGAITLQTLRRRRRTAHNDNYNMPLMIDRAHRAMSVSSAGIATSACFFGRAHDQGNLSNLEQ